MHTLESFATSCGVKINRPYIYEKYYPLNFDKYIILDTNDNKAPAKNYDYWQEVVNLILPELNKANIKILQTCAQNDLKLLNAYTVIGETYNQKAYLIKNAQLYAGSNNFGIQLASYLNKKTVALYGNIYAAQNKPYWSKDQDIVLIEGFEKGKPSYAAQEQPKLINEIKPDKIAEAILNKLDIKPNVKYKFTNIGLNFNTKTIEMLPTMIVNTQAFNVPHIIVRMDLHFSEIVLETELAQNKCIIVTEKSISEEIIKKHRANIVQIIYKIDKDNNPNFIKLLKSLNIQYGLMSDLEQEEIDKIKINYMDLGLIIKAQTKTKKDFNVKGKYYKSNHFILSDNKLYMSEAAVEKDLPIKDFNENIQEIIDTDTFWKYAENYAFLVD
jgi:hypothetical protein